MVAKKVTEKWLKELGAYYFFPVANGYMSSGVPDIIACHRGLFVGIECKANGNKPTALQQKHLRDISIANGKALLVDETNLDMLEFYIKGKQTFNVDDKK